MVVIATKGEVNPAHKRQSLIDDDHLLVMGPEKDICLDVVGVTKYLQYCEQERRVDHDKV